MDESSKKLWAGRFTGPTGEAIERFNASIGFDQRLYRVDIIGCRAQARALKKIGVLTSDGCERILRGLDQVEAEIAEGSLALTDDQEDIHMAVERRLTEIVGPAGGKIHTGRSRNDQVALDERLYLREAVQGSIDRIDGLQSTLLDLADRQIDVLMPGYTHLQQAQPIRFSHYILALFWMLERDRGRLVDCAARADAMPLGSGALAGSAYPVDREDLAAELGFSRTTENSLDAVSDRDYLLEFMSAAAILMGHLSRYCEDLIIWSTAEFGFVELADAYSTGSSMMPQKKNPDSLELVRGKTGRVYGNLISLLTVMKGLPLTYAKDMQEDKEPFFDTVDTLWASLEVFTGVWMTAEFHSERMSSALDGTILATDLADYLTRKGVPFRECHAIVGRIVRKALDEGKRLEDLDHEALASESEHFGPDVSEVLSAENSTANRDLPGGTGRGSVRAQIDRAWRILADRIRETER
ncbi:MAG: argininosuccinate lyase [Candidatus Latescibacteria bacterium]|jgi:argininosuccinate lyase|nr:argininosuccinate lyase [Candidatus Latescibacterota bacterium]